MISVTQQHGVLALYYDQLKILEHSPSRCCIELVQGAETVDMYRGNYFITDALQSSLPLESCQFRESLQEGKGVCTLTFFSGEIGISCEFREHKDRLQVSFSPLPKLYNRLVLRLFALPDEHIWGCGEQFSYFDLRGKNFPLWTQEQGVGRNKATAITQTADALDRAGGDYHTTFYPQPTYVSSRSYFLHADTGGYADFDFSHAEYHRLTFWEVPASLTISHKKSLLEVVSDISLLLGRQAVLPSWVYDGIILGMQGGTGICLEKLGRMRACKVPVNGLWIQDWQGEKYTSFGKRLRWNWQWDQNLYPDLDRQIVRLAQEGVRTLGYINPYVLKDHPLYEEAKRLDLLGKREDGSIYFVDFGEFDAAVVDFTNPDAVSWYKEVIKRELLDFGLSGWMADFGEYLPTDIHLFNHRSAMLEHNRWPGYWAKVNKQAIQEQGKEGQILFFMRAGSSESLRSCPMMWAGDQNVDWSEDDGLPSALTGALSLAMSGMGLHHSDIGGYTTLYGMKRSKQLLIRWTEFAAFTPLMRTHEGNRPLDNWQFDSDQQTIDSIRTMTEIHVRLKEYLIHAVKENAEHGWPVMRPVFLHYPQSPFFTCKDIYLLGRDLLVAPVLVEDATSRSVNLPDDRWIHLFRGTRYTGGTYTIQAPLLEPAVFYRESSEFSALFASFNRGTEALL
ncbi:MAG: alpha-glucosidase [Sphaerochaeta sp.]|uniref:alpha-glucosidase n=1 Tax=Sphaerochaeta sp. TaxID=1972642 RepID=UPI003D0AFB77